MRAILIVGLPGSGKSYTLRKYDLVDWDIHDDLRNIGSIEKSLLSGRNVVIADVNLCDINVREDAEAYLIRLNTSVEWIFFENDPEQCRKNVEFRKTQGDLREVEGTIRRFSKIYNPPENSLKVWKCP